MNNRVQLPDSPIPYTTDKYTASIERPSDVGQRVWDVKQREEPLVSPDVKREQPGWAPNKRREDCSKWMFPFVGRDDVRGELPSDIAAVREEVLGDLLRDESGALRLKVGFHPLMHRWCEFTMVRRPDLGEAGQLWQVCYIYMEEPQKRYLPPDLRHEKARQHFTGMVGDYALPERQDFEKIRRFSARHEKLGSHLDRLNRLSNQLRTQEEASEREHDDQVRDIADYSAAYEINQANQRAGSGWKMQSHMMDGKGVDAIPYKEDPKRYRVTEKKGYKVIERRTAEEWAEIQKEAQKLFEKTKAEATEKKQQELDRQIRTEISEHDRRLKVANAMGRVGALKKTL